MHKFRIARTGITTDSSIIGICKWLCASLLVCKTTNMKLWRLLILVATFGPCPHVWADLMATTIAPGSHPVVDVCPAHDCCHDTAPTKPDAPLEPHCSCNELVYLPAPHAELTDTGSVPAMMETALMRDLIVAVPDVSVSTDVFDPRECSPPLGLHWLRI